MQTLNDYLSNVALADSERDTLGRILCKRISGEDARAGGVPGSCSGGPGSGSGRKGFCRRSPDQIRDPSRSEYSTEAGYRRSEI